MRGTIASIACASHSSSYQTQADYTEGGIQDAYWLLNAALRLSPRDERYRISLVGRNLTNSYYKITTNNQSLGTPDQYTATLSRPREVLVELGYNF
jgi:outer membrane receptor protein involved in Fe transport